MSKIDYLNLEIIEVDLEEVQVLTKKKNAHCNWDAWNAWDAWTAWSAD